MIFDYKHVRVQNMCAVYNGVKLRVDIDWDHGPDIEAVLNLRTGHLHFEEWLDEQQVVNRYDYGNVLACVK
jgi:hypothetical protein